MLIDITRTEPNTDLETLKLRTFARRDGNEYVISGQKMYLTLGSFGIDEERRDTAKN